MSASNLLDWGNLLSLSKECVGTTHTRSRAHTRGGAQEAEGAQTGSEQGVRPAREGAGAHTEPCDGDGECEGTEPLSNSHICD